MYPKIYLGDVPPTEVERRRLRRQSLSLQTLLRAPHGSDPTYLLVHFDVSNSSIRQDIDLLLLRPNAIIVGMFWEHTGPIEVHPGAPWIDSITRQPIEPDPLPLQQVKQKRDMVRHSLNACSERLLGRSPAERAFERTIGALICPAAAHPDSSISLDIDDHLQLLKVLALEELLGVIAMVQTGITLTEEAMQIIVGDLFAGDLWHDGTRFVFELTPTHFQLRVVDAEKEKLLPLMEGENVIGRRRSATQYEHRLTLTGDDLISIDHAQLICEGDQQVLLRDTSKNGTWLVWPDGSEELLRGGEQVITPGTVLRMGMTRLRLERVQTNNEM